MDERAEQRNTLLNLANSFVIEDLFDLLHMNYSIIDIDGNYVAYNQSNAQMISQGKLNARDIDLPTWLNCLEVMRSGEILIKEEPFKDRFVLSIKKPIKFAGKVIGIIAISCDITEKKLLEQERQANAIHKKVIQKLKTIAGSLSHEIRTPLTGLKLGLSGLKRFLSKGEKACHQLEQAPSKSLDISAVDFARQLVSVDKMLSHIDMSTSLMDIQLKNMVTEQIDTEKFVQCDIQTCISESLDTFPFPVNVSRDCIQVAIDKPFQFWGDAVLLRHVLWNLLNNALHFIKEEGKGEVFISTSEQGDNYILSFKDTAKGMPSEDAKKVFSRYYSKRSNGTGLGLNFCQLVMEAFGGSIRCQAEEGEYAEFILSFPCSSISLSSKNNNIDEATTIE